MARAIVAAGCWFALLNLFGSAPVSADGLLSSARSEVRDSSSSSPKSASSPGSHSDEDDDGDSFFGSLLTSLFSSDCECDHHQASSFTGGAVFTVLASPWLIPRSILEDKDEVLTMADFPYAENWDGYFVNQVPQPEWAKPWSGRFLAESGTNFDGLQKHGGRLRLDTSSRWGLDTEWNFRRETLSSVHDTLWNGDANLVYRFAQSRRAAFYTGLGVNWLSDRFGGNAGFNFTYGADFYPADPWVISGVIDWGTLGHATMFHGRATVGMMLNRLEVFTGYDYLKLGGTSLPSFVAGVQLHF
ncbi:MAG: hypothetical protein FJ302_08460 [Planctomycetes bacterium]|nr:hypothetical protein [Planctomycetota bacterium]